MKYPKLFERAAIGPLKLKNRIVLPPMGAGLSCSNGEASAEIIRYYEERAKGGCGLIFTEITRVDSESGIGALWQLSAEGDKYVQRLMMLTSAVHRHDTKIFLQLHHPGREVSSQRLDGRQPVAPSPIPCGVVGEMPRELSTAECEMLVKKFVKGAAIAQKAGFDGVELHAAHGYLINQFLSPYTNKRTDRYGGNFTNRARFITEIILGIRTACGPRFPVSVRMSVDEFVEGGLKLEDSVKIARYLESLGICAIDVSCGTYESAHTAIEPYYLAEGWKKHLAKAIRENVKIPVIAVNNIKHPACAEALLEEGVCDFIAVGRGQLADPQWGNKAKEGREDTLRKCIGCLVCFQSVSSSKPLACTVNPVLGRETIYNDDTLVKNGDGKPVVVVGGGPGGMHAGWVLAKRGYKVTLLEKEGALGGTLNIGDKPPHKALIGELVQTQINEIAAAGVEVKLNTTATVENVKALNPYGVVLAFGGTPIVPQVEGIEKPHVHAAEAVLAGTVKLSGKKVVVIGGGVTGLETAEVLGADNTVTVVEMMGDVAPNLYATVRLGLLGRLKQLGVEIITKKSLCAVDENSVTLRSVLTQLKTELPADAVVLAVGVRPNHSLAEAFEENFEKVITVGDASQTGQIVDAMKEANDKSFVF